MNTIVQEAKARLAHHASIKEELEGHQSLLKKDIALDKKLVDKISEDIDQDKKLIKTLEEIKSGLKKHPALAKLMASSQSELDELYEELEKRQDQGAPTGDLLKRIKELTDKKEVSQQAKTEVSKY